MNYRLSPTRKRFALLSLLMCALALPLDAQKKGGGGGGGSPPTTPEVAFAASSGTYQLRVMNADGSNARDVLPENCGLAFPSLSPDGRMVAFTKLRAGDTSCNLWVVDVDGNSLRAVTALLQPPLTVSRAGEGFPVVRAVWSPVPAADGQYRLLFADRTDPAATIRQIFVINLDGSGRTQLTDEPLGVGTLASYEWSPEAMRVIYHAYGLGMVLALLTDFDGTLAIVDRTPLSVLGIPQSIGWSNAGNRIAFSLNADIWIVDLNAGTLPLQLTSHRDNEVLPTFSADDRRVIFTSGTSVVAVNADGTDSRTVLVSRGVYAYHRRN